MNATNLRESHPIEQIMGIRYFSSSTDGIGGRIRFFPKDFKVEEILSDGRIIKLDDENFSLGEDEPGLFTEFILIKKNIESQRALHNICKALRVQKEDINVAGTKDKTAHTAQHATIWKVPGEKLLELQLPRITIRSPRTTIYKTYLGNLAGNHFTITIRECPHEFEEIQRRITAITKEIEEFGGVANYFGHQRFGSRRPISHKVGREILLGNVKEAIWMYLTEISENEHEKTTSTRKKLLETQDYATCMEEFPPEMMFEKNILRHLVKYPNNFQGAFNVLPKNLRRMFVHAYQSFIWNMMLSERMKNDGNIRPKKDDIFTDNGVVQPIIGYETDLQDNRLNDYLNELLEKDGTTLDQFKLPHIPNMKFSGTNRRIDISPKNWSVNFEENENDKFVNKQFSLGRGSYATIILREFMKVSPIYY